MLLSIYSFIHVLLDVFIRICHCFCQMFLVTAENMTELNLRPCSSAGKLIISLRVTSCSFCFYVFIFCLISRNALTGASGGAVSPVIFDVSAAKKSFILIREAVCTVKAAFQRLPVSWEVWTEAQNNLKSRRYGEKSTLKRSRCSFFLFCFWFYWRYV